MVDETQASTDAEASFLHVDAKYWLPEHPSLVYAPASFVSQDVNKVTLKADEDFYEAEFDAADL